LRYAAEFHREAIESGREPRLDDSELWMEYDRALAGLRQLVAGRRELTRKQRSLTRLLAENERREHGPHLTLIRRELRYLREHAERAGVWLTDSELVYLAVRNVTWERHTRSPRLSDLRRAATDTLLATASSDLIPLLSPAKSARLVRVDRTPVSGLGPDAGVGARHGPLLSRPSRASRQATDADLAIIRAEMTMHPDGHGVILVPEGDRLRDYALELRGSAGDVTLVAHGDAAGIYWPAADADVRLTPSQVAELLHGRTEFRRWLDRSARVDSELVVCACSVGAGVAIRQLADEVGLPARAPDAVVLVHPATADAPAHAETNGGWVRAEPHGFARFASPPTALTSPAMSGEPLVRVGPPGVRVPVAPRAPPVLAGPDGSVRHDARSSVGLDHPGRPAAGWVRAVLLRLGRWLVAVLRAGHRGGRRRVRGRPAERGACCWCPG
jgi:hypothetical protein